MKIFKRLHWLVATTQGAGINNFSYRKTLAFGCGEFYNLTSER